MTNRRNPENKSSQKSVFYHLDMFGEEDPFLPKRPNYFHESYPSMLIEDITTWLIPYRMSKDNGLKISIDTTTPQIEDLIIRGMGEGEYDRNLKEATREFFRECAQMMMAYKEAIYEIVYYTNSNDEKVFEFNFALIHPLTLFKRGPRLFQFVPPKIAKERGVSQNILLPSDQILTFKLPQSVGDKFDDMLKRLSVLGNQLVPEFILQEQFEGKQIPFDSTTHIRTEKMALAEAVKIIGWNARGLFGEEILEYYWMYRELLFRKFVIELRESILATLNKGLKIAGQTVGFSAQIKIEGLPTIKEVTEAFEQLKRGDLSFEEIMKPFISGD